MALSACGRFSVMVAIASPAAYSGTAGCRSSPSVGGPKSIGRLRLLSRGHGAAGLSESIVLGSEFRARPAKAGRANSTRRRYGRTAASPGQPAPDGLLGDCVSPVPGRSSNQRILFLWRTDEDAVVQPLGLDELELALEMCAGEDKDDALLCRHPRARRPGRFSRSCPRRIMRCKRTSTLPSPSNASRGLARQRAHAGHLSPRRSSP